MARPVVALAMCAGVLIAAVSCGLIDDPVAPSTTTPPTETFTGTLAPKGSRTFTFNVPRAGSVSATLRALTPSKSVGLELGTASSANGSSGTNACNVTTSTPDATPGSTPQITFTANMGSHCVRISDNGNVTESSTFTIDIVHP